MLPVLDGPAATLDEASWKLIDRRGSVHNAEGAVARLIPDGRVTFRRAAQSGQPQAQWT